MKETFAPVLWLPFVWILLQTYLLLSLTIFFLKRFKVLKTPVSGMEYSHVAMAASVLLGALFISTGDMAAMFQISKIYTNGDGDVLKNMLAKCSQYFLILVTVVAVYIVLGILNNRFFFRETKLAGSEQSNLPLGLLVAAINLGLSVIFWFCFKELAESILPVFVNFR